MDFRQKGLCLLLSLALCASLLPGAVFAVEEGLTEAAGEATDTTEEVTFSTEETTVETTEATESTEAMPVTEPSEAVTETTEPTEESTENTEETSEPATKPTEPAPKGWGIYFGQLHSHSTLSDGTATVEELFSQAAAAGLDFFAVTDRGESLAGAEEAELSRDMSESIDWSAGKSAAKDATCRDFVGLYGFEMAWPREKRVGHIVTMNTPGFAAWSQPAYAEAGVGLENYARALQAVPDSVSQFCHPGSQYGDFYGFSRYCAELDDAVRLLEVGNDKNPYKYYIQALDYGWHVAPSCNQENAYSDWSDFGVGRTAVVAEELTEQGIYNAIDNYRVYATKDTDLQIVFDQMGCRLARRNVGKALTLSATVSDPTDSGCTLEVLVTGGEVIATEVLEGNSARVQLQVPTNYPWYCLKVTQSDGDSAITAPVWLEGEANVGIKEFTCGTNLPIQGRPIELELTLQNEDVSDLVVDRIEFSIDEEIFHETCQIASIPAGEEAVYSFTPTLYSLGMTEVKAVVYGRLEGENRVYERILTVSFRRDDIVTDIIVDGAHGNMGLENLKNLELLAAKHRIGMVFAEEEVTAEQLSKAAILLITPGQISFSEEFLQNAADFLRYGGTVLLCGTGENEAFLMNGPATFLDEVASSMAFLPGTVTDGVHNGGEGDQLYPVRINREVFWCEAVSENQYYRHLRGCAVSGGTWLVKGHDTTQTADGTAAPAVLAWEQIGDGQLFVGGSLWVGDTELAEGKNIWDAPYANRTILETILGIAPPEIPLKQIAAVPAGAPGEVCRIRGYVTAGTSREGNRFPDTVYLQDDTGGIAVTPFDLEGLEVGSPLEITGYLEADTKNKQFHPISVQRPEGSYYRFTALTGDYGQVLDPAKQGGVLVQVEGVAQRLELAEDGTLEQLLLWDKEKGYAAVLVEPYITSGSTGKNELALDITLGQEVRAMGLLHIHTDGSAVVRVRNCDEVVVIDPWPYTPDKPRQARDKSNPNTGDGIGWWLLAMGVSAIGLIRKKD